MPRYKKEEKEKEEVESNEVCELVRKLEQEYISGTPTTISKYVDFDMNENISKVDAYLNSKHTSGSTDSQGRDKPFFNIGRAARNIWYRATDLDRKNFRIKSGKNKDVIASFLATAKLHEWMNRENFGAFLNEWGLHLATYGSSVLKFVEKGDRLHCMVVPWSRIIVDPIDFDNNVKIEIIELTEAQLYQQDGYDKEMVDALCEAKKAREDLNKRKKDNRNNFIKLYEVHGLMPLSYITGMENDEHTYVQQMHVVSFVQGTAKGKYDNYTLVKGREKQDPYMITHLIKEDGRTQAVGAIESLFEAQWMVNHTAKAMKDQLDLASKLIFQTSDGNFTGQNALSAIETGDILTHAINEPITQVANSSHDISSLQSFGQQWKALGNEIAGISESMLGQNPPSGTAWRQTEAILQENHSLFQLMTQNKGLHMEEMGRKYIIPFVKTQLDTTEEVVATLSQYGIEKISNLYIKSEGIKRFNEAMVEAVINGEDTNKITLDGAQAQVRDELSQLGDVRYIKPSEVDSKSWKEVFKDFEWEAEFEITGENQDKQSALTTLNTTLQLIIAKQGQPMTPEEKLVFNKILALTGEVSAAELDSISTSKQAIPAPQPTQPTSMPTMQPQIAS